MDGADVCRTSSRASRRPPDVIAAVAILDSRWRRRKWHQPGLGVLFSIPSEVEVENGGPSASGRHLGWPHLQEPEMRSSKMATGSGRAAIFHLHLNGDRKKYPILPYRYNTLLWNVGVKAFLPWQQYCLKETSKIYIAGPLWIYCTGDRLSTPIKGSVMQKSDVSMTSSWDPNKRAIIYKEIMLRTLAIFAIS